MKNLVKKYLQNTDDADLYCCEVCRGSGIFCESSERGYKSGNLERLQKISRRTGKSIVINGKIAVRYSELEYKNE